MSILALLFMESFEIRRFHSCRYLKDLCPKRGRGGLRQNQDPPARSLICSIWQHHAMSIAMWPGNSTDRKHGNLTFKTDAPGGLHLFKSRLHSLLSIEKRKDYKAENSILLEHPGIGDGEQQMSCLSAKRAELTGLDGRDRFGLSKIGLEVPVTRNDK